MQALPTLSTTHLFPVLDEHLLRLLQGLSPAQWEAPTLAPKWRVRDVALHLLDGNLRALSMLRDGHFAGPGPASPAYQDVVQFLNELNNSWVSAGQRLSPAVLTWLLELSGEAFSRYMASLDPQAPAVFSVAWAGEEQSANWFHIARDYTEKWHHQQQIRQAVGQEEPLLTRELYHPFLATSVRALPHRYRHLSAPEGTTVALTVSGPAGDTWHLQRVGQVWELGQQATGAITTEVGIAPELAWRLFTNSLPEQEARQQLQVVGESAWAEPMYSVRAIMA
ncbi:maleylpyruvate isomerase N-terminal domain-containing protein [Hymenobacter fodinae]|uniref:Maleylpyruvate isomerase family mycothiol-dependent enzyme n=1 Tax=Hymenobacter fodinae TaxID=2510796 RepID=A0A4Z0P0M5_9BACT|nr:maleylpyruvate isomerase N-terminal domain-containing protein [Hymenobacter fodinae]TGE04705.1 maleylpyruvate isomerase family mycothiol-dependent enzyme [Hymenobacter fodinae]